MAKKAYVGVNSVARRVKKIYIGVGGVARKVKKAYIGIAGIARLFFMFGELKRYPSQLSYDFLEGTATSDYMVLADNTTAKAYNNSLTVTNLTAPTTRTGTGAFGAASTGEYNLFAGGYNSNISNPNQMYLSDVDCYDGDLTKISVASLPYARSKKAGVSVGNYALFGGGYGYGSNSGQTDVIAYDSSLTQSIATGMYGAEPPGTSWNYNYAFFVGGKSGENSGYYYKGDCAAYDSSLTKTDVSLPTGLITGIAEKNHCKAGRYALIAPGYLYASDRTATLETSVYAYNEALTRVYAPPTVNSLHADGLASAGQYGVISVSFFNFSTYTSSDFAINAYDESLVRTMPFTDLEGVARKGVSFGEMALLKRSAASDIYKVE